MSTVPHNMLGAKLPLTMSMAIDAAGKSTVDPAVIGLVLSKYADADADAKTLDRGCARKKAARHVWSLVTS